MKSKEKRRRQEEAQAGASISLPPKSGFGKRLLFLVALMLLAFFGVLGFCELVIWNKLPAEIVGKWVIAEGQHGGDTFEFYRKGYMVGHIYPEGKKGTINAEVRMDGKTLFFTTKNPQSGQVAIQKQIIRILTARQMVLEDEQGQTLKLERPAE